MPTLYEVIEDDIRTKSFHKMALKCSRADIETAVKAFFACMDLPEDSKKQFSFELEHYIKAK